MCGPVLRVVLLVEVVELVICRRRTLLACCFAPESVMTGNSESRSTDSKPVSATRPWWLVLAPLIFLFLWSGGYVVAKIALVYSPPMTLLVLRYSCVLLIMAVAFAVVRPPLPQTRSEWGHLFVVGLLMQAVYFGLAYLAFIQGIAAGTVALIMSLQPVLVALAASRWGSEQITTRHWLGLAIALLGTSLVIVSRMDFGTTGLGLLCAVLALMGITAATLWEKRFGQSQHPITSNLVGYTAGLIGVLPLMLWLETPHIEWTLEFAGALAYLVIGNSLVAVSLLLAMIRAGEVSKVSTLLFLVPPLTAVMAWLALSESMPLAAWLGLALAGFGVLLATRKAHA